MKLLECQAESHPWSPIKIAVVTGLSNPSDCRLSKFQYGLLEQIAFDLKKRAPNAGQIGLVTANFPFILSRTYSAEDVASQNTQPDLQTVQPNVLRASFYNTKQFFSFATKSYRRTADPHWHALFRATSRVCLICGSCGLALLSDYLVRYSLPTKVDILALGPVAFPSVAVQTASIPQVTIEVLQGSRDLLSQVCYRRHCVRIRGLGHMGYWSHPEVREFACQWLFRKISES